MDPKATHILLILRKYWIYVEINTVKDIEERMNITSLFIEFLYALGWIFQL